MSTALELATAVLPNFKKNVLGGRRRTYGYYARFIGRDPAKESMVIGKAMHVIGAACIMARVPVAPIYFVERADGEWRGIFENAASESLHVRPFWTTLFVSSRIYKYTEDDFARVERLLNELIPRYFPAKWQTPHRIWTYLIYTKTQCGTTWLQRALAHYEEIITEAKRNPTKS